MIDHGAQGGGAAIVKVRRMLPQRAQRRRPILLRGAAPRISRLLTHLGRRMQERHQGTSGVHIGEQRRVMAGCASSGAVEQFLAASCLPPRRNFPREAGAFQTELIFQERGELGPDQIRLLPDADPDARIPETAMPAHLRHANIIVPVGNRAIAGECLEADALAGRRSAE